MSKSYSRIQSDMKLIEIVEYLLQQTEPKSGADIGRALDMPHGTVMSHIVSLQDAKWVKQNGTASLLKSYKRILSDVKLIEIVEYLLQQTEPKSGADIGRGLNMPHGTVMSHLASLQDAKWIKQNGAAYEPGLRLMEMYSIYKMRLVNNCVSLGRRSEAEFEPGHRMRGMYSAYKMGLVNKIETLQRDLNRLEA